VLKIGAFEARNTFGALLDRVQGGEEIIITRHGEPVARLVPNVSRTDKNRVQDALQRIRDRAQHAQRGGFDWKSLKESRDKGRP
jgi:prevent-host-death family protein